MSTLSQVADMAVGIGGVTAVECRDSHVVIHAPNRSAAVARDLLNLADVFDLALDVHQAERVVCVFLSECCACSESDETVGYRWVDRDQRAVLCERCGEDPATLRALADGA